MDWPDQQGRWGWDGSGWDGKREWWWCRQTVRVTSDIDWGLPDKSAAVSQEGKRVLESRPFALGGVSLCLSLSHCEWQYVLSCPL